MFVAPDLFGKICETLSIVQQAIKNKGICGFYDDKKACENFFMELFNIIYDLSLKNANSNSQQYPAIDLFDEEKGICYQITCENTSSKVKDTKDKYNKHMLHEKYPNLIIFIFAHKPSKREDNPQVKYLDNLLKDIENTGLDTKNKIYKYLCDNVCIIKQIKIELEMTTIQKVIKFISEQPLSSKGFNNNIEKKPYPEAKLALRFKDYSCIVKQKYGELFSKYSPILKQAKSNYIDDGNSEKIKVYLRGVSLDFLYEESNAKVALEKIISFIMEKIDEDVYKTAIEFYLLSELIECDLFPLSEEEIKEIGENNHGII